MCRAGAGLTVVGLVGKLVVQLHVFLVALRGRPPSGVQPSAGGGRVLLAGRAERVVSLHFCGLAAKGRFLLCLAHFLCGIF